MGYRIGGGQFCQAWAGVVRFAKAYGKSLGMCP